MVAITLALWLNAIALLSSFGPAASALRFGRRSDLDIVPPINVSTAAGWTVPLQGGRVCDANGICSYHLVGDLSDKMLIFTGTDSLTAPPLGKPLQYLAVARGIYTYTCMGGGPTEVPVFQSQSTQLYDAAALVPGLPNEVTFHSLIPQLYEYDYAELENSTLECMGTIGTINDTAIVTLFDIATFEALPYESVLAPNNPSENGRWARSISPQKSWDIYRVEVAGGAPPVCGTEGLAYEKEYAAEYWFFHSTGEDLWTSINITTAGKPGDTKAFI